MSVEGRGWVTRVVIDLVNWQQEEPADFDGRRQLSMGGTSRMSREAQVRICERLGVKFPGPTRQSGHFGLGPATSGLPRSTDIVRPARLVRFVPTAEVQVGLLATCFLASG